MFGLVLQHELQHQETLLQTLQLRKAPYPVPARDEAAAPAGPDEVTVPAGPITLGTSEEPWAYDNERSAHELELAEFRIDARP